MTRRDYERLELAILRTKARLEARHITATIERIVDALEILSEEIARIKIDDEEI